MKLEAGGPFSLAAKRFANNIAIEQDGETVSYQALSDTANLFGSGLAQSGIGQGARVGVLAFNRLEVAPIWLGMERFDQVRVVLHTHFEMDVHVQTLNNVGAQCLVFDTRFTDAVDAHRGDFTTVKAFVAIGDNAPDWAVSYDDVIARGSDQHPHLSVDENAPCFIQLTTGTTGFPKPWITTHRSWRAVIMANIEHLDTFGKDQPALCDTDVNLHFHALQWATGFQTLMPYLLRGAKNILLDDSEFEPGAIVEAIINRGVTGMFMPAPMLPPIIEAYEARKDAQHSISRMVIFFATPDQLEQVSKVFGPVWCHGFGSTEQGAPTSRLTPADVLENPERLQSVGRAASSFFEMAIMDEDGRRLPAGDVGEIVVRSAMSTSTYWDLPEKTAEAFFEDDWFRPSDIGYIDADGFLFYLDRAKDRINTTLGVVYPHVVETALLGHAAVSGCGVIGLGENGQEAVVGAVVLAQGQADGDALKQDIIDFVKTVLAPRDCPSDIRFVAELPTVLGGAKVKREELRAHLEAMVSGA